MCDLQEKLAKDMLNLAKLWRVRELAGREPRTGREYATELEELVKAHLEATK